MARARAFEDMAARDSPAKLSPEELDEIRVWVESEQAKDREAK